MKAINGYLAESSMEKPGFCRMKINCPEIAGSNRAGQFIMVRFADTINPYIGRPFAIVDSDLCKETISILFKVQGEGTSLLSKALVGTALALVGPLGNGFDTSLTEKKALLIAGGAGVASIYSLAKALKGEGKAFCVMIGAANANSLLYTEDFRALGEEPFLATEDGSVGKKGYLNEEVKRRADTGEFDAAYLCGPTAMMAALSAITLSSGLLTQVSLERHLGCGFGACAACYCKVHDREGNLTMKKVCMNGPVFDAREVVWND